MRFDDLQDWLDWQESLNPKQIDLGLDRVVTVLAGLGLSADFSCPVITVAGTNGKGSTVTFLESILLSAGYTVGCYTSPHLFNYNERIRLNGQTIDDASLCQAFDCVDQARADIPLTYFEFGTLAALYLFSQAQLDVVVLEVGLGGRLDAVNVIDPDVAMITTVDIDHVDWLGTDTEQIGYEKAGILRNNRSAVFCALQMPDSVRQHAIDIQANLLQLGRDYLFQGVGSHFWQCSGPGFHYMNLPVPSLQGSYQLQNAAGVIQALHLLELDRVRDEAVIAKGLTSARLNGRYQLIKEQPQVIVDVAHNAQAARALADQLCSDPVKGQTRAVLGMLADKAVDTVVELLSPVIDNWYLAGLDVPRGLDHESLLKIVKHGLSDDKLSAHVTVSAACSQAFEEADPDDRIIILGSFYTVAEAIKYINKV
ncbi:MAG: bifunctional tetrahydrofolate synthase/dihydrofolate synthase [Gammaproteobacteria bacterium]|nr:bifunctional tetrahydrofolate synthase/dihydrofolate synthase [Gammaproteobacteria bacterium]